ncbi:hypothetical protein EVAR_50842_1 [Eumeta japonica]|uniref:Uncharacterized protein n=1 Tax=Eumeta variegata TaxID=151549 RepID=A0A4C1XE28_EUMVA|nr:hypothetical protein EVAR_50842_1 [Eumeta japonica]
MGSSSLWENNMGGQELKIGEDVIITATLEIEKDLREKLVNRMGANVKSKVRTMTSVLTQNIPTRDNSEGKSHGSLEYGRAKRRLRHCSMNELIP